LRRIFVLTSASLPDAAKTKEFETVFFNRAVLLLDYMFVHRLLASRARMAIR